jgi:hypothetical protein
MRISLTVDLPLALAMGSAASGVGRRIKLGLPMQIAALQSITKGAVRAFWRSPATKVVLFRWTCGMALIRRSRVYASTRCADRREAAVHVGLNRLRKKSHVNLLGTTGSAVAASIGHISWPYILFDLAAEPTFSAAC